MGNAKVEIFFAKVLAFSSFFTTVFLINGSVTDPVNVPKFVSLGVLSTASISILLFSQRGKELLKYKLLVILCVLFFLLMVLSTFFSKVPLSQVLYGSFGRNNGLLTYMFLTFLLLCSLTFTQISSFKYLINGLMIAGSVNLIYCLWVVLFGDFIAWENPYGHILGTLGNPNFIGAFLGIIFSSIFALVLDARISRKLRILMLLLLPICAFLIFESHAIQGRVVAAVGSSFVLFLWLRANFSNLIVVIYSIVCFMLGLISLAGALQVGPLTQFIYKYSVSLRGQYWLAAWNTGQAHPWTGVGMDAFGDWYRRMRDIHALEVPGANTVVNAAHNVPLDIFAFGGWPLFVLYLIIMAIALLAIIKVIIRFKAYDIFFAIMASSWIGYQLQSLISINQIGLAIWGWILTGALIAYEKFTRQNGTPEQVFLGQTKTIKSKVRSVLPAQVPVLALLGAMVGLVISLPPLTADMKWRKASLSRNLPALEETMSISYFNPTNSMKYLQNIQTLEQSGLNDLARKYALEAVKWNSEAFDLWKVLYLISASTESEKNIALKNMKKLDPLNPDVTFVK